MSGMKRSCPLKGKHRFFEKTGSQSSSKDMSDKNQRGNGRSHSEVQNNSSHKKMQSQHMKHSEVQSQDKARSHSEMQNENVDLHPEIIMEVILRTH